MIEVLSVAHPRAPRPRVGFGIRDWGLGDRVPGTSIAGGRRFRLRANRFGGLAVALAEAVNSGETTASAG